MEWLADPTAWLGLATLVVLEIVLGIDNLIFIAILADKLPPGQRDRARIIGLSLALIMRLGLLASLSWLVTLTAPLFTVFGHGFAGRDLIMLGGGLFLLFKATMELHERLEGGEGHGGQGKRGAQFWPVVAQIVVLDAVFSIDSVITAVGMVQHLSVMVIAVSIAMAIMLLASKPLTAFVNARPTVIVLCLGFLMMIGFSLIAEGIGFHIPKGYLYAAIGFSIMIEVFNQLARAGLRKRFGSGRDRRERAAEAVLSLLGGRAEEAVVGDHAAAASMNGVESRPLFGQAEKAMIRGVLDLGRRQVRSIMTPRPEVEWIDLDDPSDVIRQQLTETGHTYFPVARGDLDHFSGIARARDLMARLLAPEAVAEADILHQPLIVHESMSVLRLLEQFRNSTVHVALVLDEYGSIEGIVTTTDILEAIAGEFSSEGDTSPLAARETDGSWSVDAGADLRQIEDLIGRRIAEPSDAYSTVAGFVLWSLGRLPEAGDSFERDGLRVTVEVMDGRRVDRVRIVDNQAGGEA